MDVGRFLSMLLSLMACSPVTLGQSRSPSEDLHPTMTQRLLEIQTTTVKSLVSTSRGRHEASPSIPPTKVSGNTPRAGESWSAEEITGNTSVAVQASSQTKNQSADSQPADTSTEGMQSTTTPPSKVSLSAATPPINQITGSTRPATSVPPLASTASERSTSLTTNDKTASSPASLSSTPPTNPSTLPSLSTQAPEYNSTNTDQVTGGATTVTTSSYKTSRATTKMSSIPTTTRSPPSSGRDKDSNKRETHGIVVTWIIGGALVVLMVAILVIYVKKRRIKKEQVTTKDWAGPSPFLEDGVEGNGKVELRSSNRISLSSFLPVRLSRRLSMLQETDEALEDINTSTFGDKHHANNGTSAVIPGDKVKGGAQKTGTGPTSPQTKDLMSENNHTPPASTNLTQDSSANTPTPSEAANSIPPSQPDDASDQLKPPSQPTYSSTHTTF